MLKKELVLIFKTAKPVLRHPAFDIKKAVLESKHGHLIVVTPRSIGNAPQRNLVRRRLKAIFYEKGFKKKDVAWIIFVKKEACLLSFAELQKIVCGALATF